MTCFLFALVFSPCLLPISIARFRGRGSFFRGSQLIMFDLWGHACFLKKYSFSDTFFYMSSQSWFLVDLVSFLGESILCYLTLFSQVYFFTYRIKNFEVSMCIILMYMMTSCFCTYCLQEDSHKHVGTPTSFCCSDAYSQDTCYMCISFTLCFYFP
jgi:hypothetical protein